MTQFIENYNSEVDRWHDLKLPPNEQTPEAVDLFVDYEKLKWSRDLKADLRRGRKAEYSNSKIHQGIYRPFAKKYIFLDRILNEEVYNQPVFFPTPEAETENTALWIKQGNTEVPWALAIKGIPDVMPNGGSQCFPFYTYDPDGTNRRENITDTALTAYQTTYGDPTLTKRDLFATIYALLHHPDYRTRYQENLKRELPRIPFVGTRDTAHALADAGERLLHLHTTYETADEFPLTDEFDRHATLADIFRVEKMRYPSLPGTGTTDKTALVVNSYLTLRGIPPEAHDYKLGSRSALDWIVDQYRVKGDSDPNRADDPSYIVRLVKQIVTVSVETVKVVTGLPPLGLGE